LTPEIDDGAWLARWDLVPDGEAITTPSSLLLPVRHRGQPAMLKIAREEEERRGGRLMAWWDGDGVARVLAHDDHALLLERATGPRTLAAMVAAGADDEATRILCAVAGRLHAPRRGPPPELVPLSRWFEALAPAARSQGGLLAEADAAARELLADPREPVVLHGDIHHGNVLDGAGRGWLAIDPKGLHGERAFDYANIFCNPDRATATAPGRLERRLDTVSEAAHLDRGRLLKWVVAYAGLSAAWSLEDGEDAALALTVMRLAGPARPDR